MIIQEFEIVINVEYGGFSLDTEMALWLIENKGWTESTTDSEEFDLTSYGNYFYPTKKYVHGYDNIKFRMHPDLIECVTTLHKKYENVSWNERRGKQVLCLRVVKVAVNIDVEDVHAGKEKVIVSTTDW